uniref:Uncharacterized protein n=1 Tax=Candidatus Kentrum sp. TC TaxID=2126339 RepID=A0A450YJ62_9GAMM|nr:MAG: hypothetical protein BECKTC1821E_GA0114239_101218 [Candidatus Kentron sp. TC]
MKNLKTTIIAWALSMLVAMPALASNESVPRGAAPTQFTETDIESLFEQGAERMSSSSPAIELAAGDVEALFEQGVDPMQLAMLSPEEMEATEGEWLPLAIFAARVAYSGWKAYRAYKQTKRVYRGYRALRSGYRYAKPKRWEHLRLKNGGHSLRIKSHRGRVEFRAENHPRPDGGSKIHFHARPGIGKHRTPSNFWK